MKKTIVSIGALLLMTGCSLGGVSSENPDQAAFDENYQGSPMIDQENAAQDDAANTEQIVEPSDEMMLQELPPVPDLNNIPVEEVVPTEEVLTPEPIAPEAPAVTEPDAN